MSRSQPRPDPPVPPDGSCIVCGKPRRLQGLRSVYREPAERDPFCSAPCARRWHGAELPPSPRDRVTNDA
jgi:hypothetical protein